MGKIKGWKRTSTVRTNGEYRFISDGPIKRVTRPEEYAVIIIRPFFRRTHWTVYIMSNASYPIETVEFKSREEALSYAEKWMRRNTP